ncbi:MAG: Phosphoglycerate kinase [Acidimicrobiales bacterium]|nr:Phosphoglycerate kinase [Acidimicrobiales bacterium]
MIGNFADALATVADTDRWPEPASDLRSVVEAVPPLEELAMAPGCRVVVRGDLDLPLEGDEILDDSRIEATTETVEWLRAQGHPVVLIGHIGRDPELTLRPVAAAFGRALSTDVTFVDDWFDEAADQVRPGAREVLDAMAPGEVVMLENLRRYGFETEAWKLDTGSLVARVDDFEGRAVALRDALGEVEVLECIAASNFDFSSAVLPLAMSTVGLGRFMRSELLDRLAPALESEVLLMSGLKANKLDDLERIVTRRSFKLIFVGGSLAMPMLAARHGSGFSMGRVAVDGSLPSYVPAERIEQAKRILDSASERGIEVLLPVDFVLDDGTVTSVIPADRVQFDIGPRTVMELEAELDRVIAGADHRISVFLNGSAGRYEDPNFDMGTRSVVELLQDRWRRREIDLYVGGGDGRAAVERFGAIEDVTYAFTSGGTILKLLADRSIPFLNAAYLVNRADRQR